jgi:hypothetical protein
MERPADAYHDPNQHLAAPLIVSAVSGSATRSPVRSAAGVGIVWSTIWISCPAPAFAGQTRQAGES